MAYELESGARDIIEVAHSHSHSDQARSR
jgi:hypothetical protein